MSDFLRAALAVCAKDIRVEHRSRTALISAIAFAALVLVIFNFARDPASVSREAMAPSVLWITFTFSGVIALNRSFALERENGALDGLLFAAGRGQVARSFAEAHGGSLEVESHPGRGSAFTLTIPLGS